MKAAQIDVIRTSQFTAQTAFHAERFNWQQTPAGVPLPVFDFLVTLATFPDFTSAWLAYARQLLTNRSDKELVTRVWLHTNVWTTDPDRRGKWRQWTEDDFTHKDIARCIERDTEVRVSERTVRAVLSQMRAEERARTPMARVADRDIGS